MLSTFVSDQPITCTGRYAGRIRLKPNNMKQKATHSITLLLVIFFCGLALFASGRAALQACSRPSVTQQEEEASERGPNTSGTMKEGEARGFVFSLYFFN